MVGIVFRTADSTDALSQVEGECTAARYSISLKDPRQNRKSAQSFNPHPAFAATPPHDFTPVRDLQKSGGRQGGKPRKSGGGSGGDTRKRSVQLSADEAPATANKKFCTGPEHSHLLLSAARTTACLPNVGRGVSTAAILTSTRTTNQINCTSAGCATEHSSPTVETPSNQSKCRWPDDSQVVAQPQLSVNHNLSKVFAPPPPPHVAPRCQSTWKPHGGKRKRTAHADSEEIHMVRKLATTFREHAVTSKQSTATQPAEKAHVANRPVPTDRGGHLESRDLVGSIIGDMNTETH